MLIALYVDNSRSIAWIKGEVRKRFEMKDLGEARVCLGLEISRDRANRTIHIYQKKYTQSVLERFVVHNASQCRRLWSLDSRASHGPIPKPRTNLPPTFRIDKPSVA